MCKFQDYTFKCGHEAITTPFCTDPCPHYNSFAQHGLRFRRTECPDYQVEQTTLSLGCQDCMRVKFLERRWRKNPPTKYDESKCWYVSVGAAEVEHLRTTDPWEDDRQGRSRAETEQRAMQRMRERSVSPMGRSGSGVSASIDKGTVSSDLDGKVNRALQNAGQVSTDKRASSAAKSRSWSSGEAATESTAQYPREKCQGAELCA